MANRGSACCGQPKVGHGAGKAAATTHRRTKEAKEAKEDLKEDLKKAQEAKEAQETQEARVRT